MLSGGRTGKTDLKEKGVFCLYFSVAKGVAKAKNNSCA